MTEKELEICRSKYNKIQEEKIKLGDMQKELDQLKESPEVKRYFELLSLIDSFRQNFQESNMLMQAFNETAMYTKNKAEVYAYIRTYRLFGNTKFIENRTEPINPMYYLFMYSEYMNIETGQIKTVEVIERYEFERSNTIIFPPKHKLEETDDFTVNANNIRLWYFKELLNSSQEVVIRKLTMHTDAIKKHFY